MIPKAEVLLLQRENIYIGKQGYPVKTESRQYKVILLWSDTKKFDQSWFVTEN